MALPPAKRQKRMIVLSSDDEEDGSTDIYSDASIPKAGAAIKKIRTIAKQPTGRSSQASLPTRTRAKPKRSTRPSDPTSSNGTTPTSSPAKSKTKSGSLYSFFNAVTQSQQATSTPGAWTATPIEQIDEEDLIEDDPFEEKPTRQSPSRNNLYGTGLGKKSRPAIVKASISDESRTVSNKLLPSSTAQSKLGAAGGSIKAEDPRPWAEQFPPMNLEELAVHKRKSADVKNWLDNVINGKDRKRLLILKGPSGSGKTATLSALSKLMDFDIVEWNNPLSADYSTEGFRSISAQFEDFLERSGKFGALTLRETSSTDAINPASNLPDVLLQRKKVILLEEFPNVFSRTSSALLSFRSNVLHYLAATTPSPEDFFNIKQEVEESAVPLIMIISETRPTSTTSSTDSFTAHRILGPNILNHPGTTIIEFNPIAPTIITKALQLVAQKEARRSGRKGGPHNAVLKKLGEVGDIRSAIYSLEFLCLGKASDVNWSDLSSAKNKKVGKETPSKAKNEQESIETITQREASLGIFHAVGRVVYNKREECKPSDLHTGVPVQPPDHQQHHNRPMVSTVKVDDLMDETGTDTATFIAALHENYAPSCDSPTSTDALNGCIDALSDSDLLSPDRSTGFSLQEGFNRGIYAGSGSESLRQNEICFHVAVRGILFALPHPVKRRMPGSIGAGRAPGRADAFKMYYPTSLRLWKRREEIEGLIERWSDPLNDPAAQKGRSEGVDTWKKRVSVSAVQASSPVKADAPTTRPLLMGGDSARTEMILERLPYIAKIERSRHSRGSVYRELEKITTFHGIGGPTDVEPDEEDEPTVPTSNVPVFTQKSRGTEKGFADLSASQNESALEKLVISDDDIEDC